MTDDNITDFPSKTPDPEAPWGRKADGTPRKPNAVQQRHASGYTPQEGAYPASRGKHDKGGAGSGQWGGPAKGAGNRGAGPGRPTKAISQMKAEERTVLEQELLQLKWDIAHNGEYETTRLAAIQSIENRLLGLPPAKVAHVGGDEGDSPIQNTITIEFIKAKA